MATHCTLHRQQPPVYDCPSLRARCAPYKGDVRQHQAQGVADRLKSDGVICDRVFTRDFEFSSPSAASSVVRGYSTSGNVKWQTADGTQLKDLWLLRCRPVTVPEPSCSPGSSSPSPPHRAVRYQYRCRLFSYKLSLGVSDVGKNVTDDVSDNLRLGENVRRCVVAHSAAPVAPSCTRPCVDASVRRLPSPAACTSSLLGCLQVA